MKKKLIQILNKAKNIKERNTIMVQAYKDGYSQQMIADISGITQQAVCSVIKRSRK
jgi:DNA-directed RNA polymerase specialized sigma subunit